MRAKPGRTSPDAGVISAEYAVVTLAAITFGAALYKVLSSDNTRRLLAGMIQRALS